jgi:hypothetical protein
MDDDVGSFLVEGLRQGTVDLDDGLDAAESLEGLLRLFACDCAERTLRQEEAAGREPDQRSWQAIYVSRRYALGKASRWELEAANREARAAWVELEERIPWEDLWRWPPGETGEENREFLSRSLAWRVAQEVAQEDARQVAGAGVRGATLAVIDASQRFSVWEEEQRQQCLYLAELLESALQARPSLLSLLQARITQLQGRTRQAQLWQSQLEEELF